MRLTLLAALLMLANHDGNARGADGQPLPPGSPRNSWSDLGDGLGWQLAVVPDLTTADSVWLNSDLRNSGERPFRVEWKPDAARPRLILSAKGKAPLSRPLRKDTPTQKLVYAAMPAPQQSVFSVRVDLRSVFGKLEEGEYEAQIVLPEAGYALTGLPGFKPRELASPKVKFQVVDADLEALHRIRNKNYPEIAHAQKPVPKGDGVSATLTNTLKEPLTIPLAAGEDGKKQPVRVNAGWSRWHPKHFWVDGRAPESDEKLPTYRLAPGETVKVILPDTLLDGDGVYAFWLLCPWGADPKKMSLAQIYSQPFVVDQVRPPAAK